MRAWIPRHSLATYFLLAYCFSWAIEIPLAARAQGWTSSSPPFWFHYFAAYGPFLAALITTGLTGGKPALLDLGRRMIRWRLKPIWWLAAFSPVALYAVSAVILRAMRSEWLDLSALGRVNFLPDLGPAAFLVWLFTYGVGEETGWRGFALPSLQRKRTPLSASLVLALGWIGWHLPSLLYLPSYQQLGLRVLPMFALGISAGAIVFTWLYNGSGGSILLASVGHAALNYVTAPPGNDPAVAAIVSTAIMIWAGVVVFIWTVAGRTSPIVHSVPPT